MLNRLAQNRYVTLLLLVVIALVVGCIDTATSQVTPQPTTPLLTTPGQPTPRVSPPRTPNGPKNTLAILEPAAGTLVSGQVLVRGQGIAYENTILVDVVAGGKSLGKAIGTTDAPEIGAVGTFTVTVPVAPVQSDTDALVTIFTTSPVDDSVDQYAEVPIKVVAQGKAAPTQTYVHRPNIRISPTRGKPGTEITVVGGGFESASEVRITLGGQNTGSTSEVYATTRAGEHGNIQVSFRMPERWPNGELIVLPEIVVLASTPDFVDKATATFTLESPTPPQASPTRDQ